MWKGFEEKEKDFKTGMKECVVMEN